MTIHGTHVAGIINRGNNARGITGVLEHLNHGLV
jgi:hypothetical protein